MNTLFKNVLAKIGRVALVASLGTVLLGLTIIGGCVMQSSSPTTTTTVFTGLLWLLVAAAVFVGAIFALAKVDTAPHKTPHSGPFAPSNGPAGDIADVRLPDGTSALTLRELSATKSTLEAIRRRDKHAREVIIRQHRNGPPRSEEEAADVLRRILTERYPLRQAISGEARLQSDLGLDDDDLVDLVGILETALNVKLQDDAQLYDYRDATVLTGGQFLFSKIATSGQR